MQKKGMMIKVKSDTLKMISEVFCSDISSKVIVANDRLEIVYTNRPLIFDKLSPDMFSRSNAVSDFNGIFPIDTKTTLSLKVNGISYIAIVRPYHENGETYYIIEALDSQDFCTIEQLSQASLSELNRLSKLREASSLIYSAQLLMGEQAQREGFENRQAMKMFDKSCYLILSATANKSELQYYSQEIIEAEPVNLSQVTEDLCAMCRTYLGRRNIGLIFDNIENNIIVKCDSDRYITALLNLIVNSALYNISEHKQIEVSLKRSGNEARITVKDNGLGMSLDDIEKAFTPYALCKLGSTGDCLGLPIVNMFANAFGGSANIVSKPDNGTSVTIRLPAFDGDLREMQSPLRRYVSDKFSAINVYLSQIEDE